MKQRKKIDIRGHKLAVWLSVAGLLLTGLGLVALYRVTGWYPLLLTGLIQLLPAVVQLVLLLPIPGAPIPPVHEEAEGRKARIKSFLKDLGFRLRSAWYRGRRAAVVILIAAGAAAAHLLFWKSSAGESAVLNYAVPVALAVLFVVGIALEKWCRSVHAEADSYAKAQLQGLCSGLRLMRLVLLLTMTAAMLRLLEIYNADAVLQVLLSLLFAYETACLGFSLAVRGIRKELDTYPEVLANLVGMGSDMNILRYLEENTGITMRSLWSLQLVKELLPSALAAVLLLVWLSTGVVQIQPNEKGVLYRMGKLQGDAMQPGFHVTLPWPFDKVQILDTESVRSMAIGYVPNGKWDNIWTESHGGKEYRMLLGNGEEVVTVNLLVEYRIADALQFVKCSASPESIVEAQAYKIITKRTISTDMDALLAADREAFSESFCVELAQQLAPYETGIEVVNVVLENIHPPMEVALVYQRVISAEILAESIVLEAQNDANQQILTAKEQAVEAVGDAMAEKYESVAAAQSAVTEFMAAVAADDAYSQQYRFYKYMDAVTRAYSGAKLIIAGEGVNTGHLYIGSMEKEQPKEEEVQGNPGLYEEEVEEEYWEMTEPQTTQPLEQSEG